jgi:hypothetical protein
VSNLVPSCIPCNQDGKKALSIEKFLAHDPKRLAAIKAQLKAPLKDAAAVNVTRWALYEALADTGLPVEASSGGRTKYDRAQLGIAKTHAFDAACVGKVGTLVGWQISTLAIKAMGCGSYCRTKLTAHGFRRAHCMRAKSIHGFKTGIGRVAVRASGSFNVQTPTGVVQGINARRCTILHRADGYKYHQQRAALPLPASTGSVRANFR